MSAAVPAVQRIGSPEAFAAVAAEWDALLGVCDGRTWFQSHAFLSAWWRQFGAGMGLQVICVREHGRLAGAVALQRLVKRRLGRELGVLQFLGMPDEIFRPVLLVPSGRSDLLQALLDGIAGIADRWSVLQLDEVPANAWFLGPLRAWARDRGLRCRIEAFHACPYLQKQGSWQQFVRAKSRRFAARLRQSRHRLERAGRVGFRQLCDAAQARSFVDTFFAVERQSWKAAGGVDIGQDDRYRALYRDLLASADRDARGHAFVLELDGRAIAATLGVSWQGVYYSLQIAHDRAYDRYSPGLLIEAHEMEWFFDCDVLHRYEFLGSEGFAKRRWTDRAVGTVRVSLHDGRLLARSYLYARNTLRPAGEAWIARLRGQRHAPMAPFRLD